MPLALTRVTTEDQWHRYHLLRRTILWDARGRSGYDDKRSEEHLPNNHPLLLFLDGIAIGTTRLDDKRNGTAIVRLVTIAANMQNHGYGRKMGELVTSYARQLGIDTLLVNAASDAVGFYNKTGWHRFAWDESELVTIAANCVQMRKLLTE